jgi:hypothetical protein
VGGALAGPLTEADRIAGYPHRLSIWQMEVSRTHVFTRPVRGREFFEQVIENRARRTETAINDPQDFGVGKDLSNWAHLRKLAAAINQRLLETERFCQDSLLSAESFAHVSEPTTTATGQRAPDLRFGQPRVMALLAALSRFAPSLNGFRHAEVREIVPALLGIAPSAYTASQMSYDLRRPRLKGLIARVDGKHVHVLATYGREVVYLMTKLHRCIFDVANAAIDTTVALPSQLARAFGQLDAELDKLVADAQLAPAKS